MTTIALKATNSVFNAIKKTLEGMMIGWMIGRQCSANREVAQQMINIGEYRQEDYGSLLADLNAKAIQSIRYEFGGKND